MTKLHSSSVTSLREGLRFSSRLDAGADEKCITRSKYERYDKLLTPDKPVAIRPNVPTWFVFVAAGGIVLFRFGWSVLAARSRSVTIEPARLTFRRDVLNREV